MQQSVARDIHRHTNGWIALRQGGAADRKQHLLIELDGAKMPQPCGRVSVKLHWADGDKKTLIGSFKSDLDGGDIKLARDD
jgi:hypothetical protein